VLPLPHHSSALTNRLELFALSRFHPGASLSAGRRFVSDLMRLEPMPMRNRVRGGQITQRDHAQPSSERDLPDLTAPIRRSVALNPIQSPRALSGSASTHI